MALSVERDLLARARERVGPGAELFLEHRATAAVLLEDGLLQEPSCGTLLGAGLRAGGAEGARYLHLESPSEERLLLAAARLAECRPSR